MKRLLKGVVLAGAVTAAYKWFKRAPADSGASTGPIRDAGPHEQHGINPNKWDKVDEASDESFPASDAPGNY